MRSDVVRTMVMSTALCALPVIGSAAPPSMMQSCVRAFISQLTAGATKPMKVLEEREVDSTVPVTGLSSTPEFELTARDAHSDRTLAREVCTIVHDKLVLQSEPLAMF